MSMSASQPQPELLLFSQSPYETPDPSRALDDPEGLSAVGGDLSSTRLIHLYQRGFFPWFSDPDPILWWHPGERCVLKPSQFHVSRSLNKAIKRGHWRFSVNQAFSTVIAHCAGLRAEKEGTWISPDIIKAYTELHRLGYAHSIEIWQSTAENHTSQHSNHPHPDAAEDTLVGGFYGIAMGNVFFGESMFSLVPNASKVALKVFCDLTADSHIELIDCQVESEHLLSLGAELMPRHDFCQQLIQHIPTPHTNQVLIQLGQNTNKQAV